MSYCDSYDLFPELCDLCIMAYNHKQEERLKIVIINTNNLNKEVDLLRICQGCLKQYIESRYEKNCEQRICTVRVQYMQGQTLKKDADGDVIEYLSKYGQDEDDEYIQRCSENAFS